jgi:hypothetical protein
MSEPDTSKPNTARVYDYMLGGTNNFAVDRQMAEVAYQIAPDAPIAARANREFLRRVVRFLAINAGIRQFLDVGSGLPTQGNVHEIAKQAVSGARTVYVDHDPMVLTQSRVLLNGDSTTTAIQADIRQPDDILSNPEIQNFIDFTQPVGLLLFGIVHHLNDHEGPEDIVSRLRAGLASESYVALSHFHNPDQERPDAAWQASTAEKLFNDMLGTVRWRTRQEILAYFDGLELLDPGLVPLPEWHPGPDEYSYQGMNYYGDHAYPPITYYTFLGGVGRKA